MPPGKRLYISPLNSEFLDVILPRPLLEKASNISLHNIQTFPERNYGYLELPDMEADKLKKKLHGSTLKGAKMKVEEARPKKQRNETQHQKEESTDKEKSDRKARKKKAKEEGVIPGHELQDRKVKRGWTDSTEGTKSSKRQKEKVEKKHASKPASVTGDAECLFKTSLPPNVAISGDPKNGKEKKRKRGASKVDLVVQEFKNTTKYPTFLRDEAGTQDKPSAAEYIEGKGWVDEDGNIVEPEPKRRKSKSRPEKKAESPKKEIMRTRSRRSSRLEAPAVQITSPIKDPTLTAVATDETSSSGTSSSNGESDSASSQNPPPSSGKAQSSRQKNRKGGPRIGGDDEVDLNRVERLSITRSSATPPSQSLPPTSAPTVPEVHPLEALFKRPNTAASHTPKKPNLEVSTSFSFFESEADGGEGQGLLVPQTPFTQQDIRQRRQRSAAPTPDTAAPGKTFGNMWEGTSDISEDEDDVKPPAGPSKQGKSATPEIKEEKSESDFSKWFWEHRGENNRAWKRRRREAVKEKRQKDNKEWRG